MSAEQADHFDHVKARSNSDQGACTCRPVIRRVDQLDNVECPQHGTYAERDRLRAENERLKEAGPVLVKDWDRAYAEVARLREALKHIAEADVALFTGKPQRPSGEYCVDVAKRALSFDDIKLAPEEGS